MSQPRPYAAEDGSMDDNAVDMWPMGADPNYPAPDIIELPNEDRSGK